MTVYPILQSSIIGRWWWSVDRWVLAALFVLLAVGALLMMSAGPTAAGRMRLDPLFFVRAQLGFLPAALVLMLTVSLLPPLVIRRAAVLAVPVFLFLTFLTLYFGPEINGARRWIIIFGQSFQPSEFLKPVFAISIAWLFTVQRLDTGLPGNFIATVLAAMIVGLLVAQPDMGNAVLFSAIWFLEFFLAGLPVVWMVALALLGMAAAMTAYVFVDHVAARVDAFLDPASADNYQVDRAMEAFTSGGLLGRGPGEGTVKASLPDAHSDFILAVAGEEFGVIACVAIVALFAFIVLRGFTRLMEENDLFVMLSVAGLLTAFGLQALMNMASTLHMMPTKGITLPFISYGGSSLLALALGMGAVLALTRRRPTRVGWS